MLTASMVDVVPDHALGERDHREIAIAGASTVRRVLGAGSVTNFNHQEEIG